MIDGIRLYHPAMELAPTEHAMLKTVDGQMEVVHPGHPIGQVVPTCEGCRRERRAWNAVPTPGKRATITIEPDGQIVMSGWTVELVPGVGPAGETHIASSSADLSAVRAVCKAILRHASRAERHANESTLNSGTWESATAADAILGETEGTAPTS